MIRSHSAHPSVIENLDNPPSPSANMGHLQSGVHHEQGNGWCKVRLSSVYTNLQWYGSRLLHWVFKTSPGLLFGNFSVVVVSVRFGPMRHVPPKPHLRPFSFSLTKKKKRTKKPEGVLETQ